MNALLKYGVAILGAVVVVVVIAAISSAVFSGSEAPAVVAEQPATPAPKATPAPAPAATPPVVAAAPAAPAAPAPAPAAADPMAAAPAPVAPAPAAPAAVAAAPAAPAAPAPAAAAAADGDLGPRLVAANAAAGQTVRVRCQTCHTFDNGGANRVGPNLWNIVGRDKGNVAGFMYSEAMKAAPGNWTYAELDAFLTAPAKHTPGTRMAFAGIASPTDRANLIVHLRTLSTSPLPLP